MRACSFRCRASCASRRRNRRWRSTRKSPTRSSLRFLEGYDIGTVLSYKGIAEGVENTNYFLHTTQGSYILTLYEKRVSEADLPFFLGLMQHLAAQGPELPAAGPQPARRTRSGALPAGPPPSSPSSTASRSAARRRSIAGLSDRRSRGCTWPGAISR